MKTTFLVWSAAAGSQAEPGAGGGGAYRLHPHVEGPLPAGRAHTEPPREGQSPPPPRPARARRKPAPPKKPPQRGLGVEQLERLRLQEQWKKAAADADTPAQPFPGHYHQLLQNAGTARYKGNKDNGLITVFQQDKGWRPLHQAGPGRVSLARSAEASAPADCGGGWAESSFLQRDGILGGVAGGFLVGSNPAAPFPDVGSAPNPYLVAMAEASLQVGNGAFTEFPSSQSLRCSDQCDLCFRKKRMLEEKFQMTEGNDEPRTSISTHEAMVHARREAREMEVKEYMFFPCSSSSSSQVGSGLKGWTTAGDAPSSSSACARSSKHQLDLSLKLSF